MLDKNTSAKDAYALMQKKYCAGTSHVLTYECTAEKGYVIRHNNAYLPISQKDIDNPNKDIWGKIVVPWIKEQHHAGE